MADSKITALTSIGTITDPAVDPLVIVDVSDTSMAATGTTKKVTLNNLLACSPTATLASATITGDLTVKTNVLKVDTTNNRVGIGTATPARPLDIVGSFQSTLGWALVGSPPGLGSSVRYIGGAGGTDSWYYNAVTGGSHLWAFGESQAMRLDATGLGVGRSPISKLTVDKASQTPGGTTPNGALVITDTVGSNLALEFGVNSAALPWIQSRNSTTGTYYDLLLNPNGGNVGIGVTPSAIASVTRLEIKGTISSNVTLRTASANASARDWMVACNVNAFGDFVFRQGNSQGAEPNSGTDRLVIDPSGNMIPLLTSTPPTLATNNQMVFNLTSNTNLRISVRGSDGVTRTANITLA